VSARPRTWIASPRQDCGTRTFAPCAVWLRTTRGGADHPFPTTIRGWVRRHRRMSTVIQVLRFRHWPDRKAPTIRNHSSRQRNPRRGLASTIHSDLSYRVAGPLATNGLSAWLEYFDGFMGVDTDHGLLLYRNTTQVGPCSATPLQPHSPTWPDDSTYMNSFNAAAPDKPVFLLRASGTHSPHQPKKRDNHRVQGKSSIRGVGKVGSNKSFAKPEKGRVIPAIPSHAGPDSLPNGSTLSLCAKKSVRAGIRVFAASAADSYL